MLAGTRRFVLNKSLDDTEKFKDASSKMLLIATTFGQWMEASKGFSIATKKIELLKMRLIDVDREKSSNRDVTLDATLKIRDLNLPLIWSDDCRKKFQGSFHYYFSLETDDDVVASEILEADTTTVLMQIPEVTMSNVSVESTLRIHAFCIFYNSALHSKPPSKQKSVSAEQLCLHFTRFASTTVNLSDFKRDCGPARPLEFDLKHVNEMGSIKQSRRLSVNVGRSRSPSTNNSQTTGLYSGLLDSWKIGLANFYVQPANVDSCKKVLGHFTSYDGKKATCMVVENDQLFFYGSVNTSITLPLFSAGMMSCTIKDVVDSRKGVIKCQVVDASVNKELVLLFNSEDSYKDLRMFIDTYKKFAQNWGSRVILPSHIKTPSEILKVAQSNPKLLTTYLLRE